MNKKGTFHIAIITDNYVKAVKDLTSGFLRYKAEAKPSCNIKFFTPTETQTARDWQQNIIEWRPDGIVVTGIKATSYLAGHASAISRKCKIVCMASDDPKLDGQMPPRSVFVDVDDAAIVEAAFNLMKKRGLESFAFVHSAEASENLRSHFRASAFRRMADEAGFAFTECGSCGDDLSACANTSCGEASFNAHPAKMYFLAVDAENRRHEH